MQTPAAATKTARKKLNPVDSTLILILIMLVTNNEYLKTKFSVLRRKKA